MNSNDFMPLEGWDHVELWVGNAKQAAYYYEHAFGFQLTAYAGPETGVRDRASYVLEQGDIRLVVTSPLYEDHEITRHQAKHGDGVRDIALTVPDAADAYEQALQRGATGVSEPATFEDDFGTIETSAIATYGDTIHTFVNRSDYAGPFKPGFVSVASNGRAESGVGLITLDHVVGNVELGKMDYWVEFYERVFGMTNILWFTAIDRVGPSRASLFGNLQPFFAVFFALVLLSETLHPLEIAGGVLIFVGIALERFWHRPAPVAPES